MPLVLSLANADSLSNGGPVRLVLDRRGAVVGRSPTVDWTLPDPACVVSSRHCEISYRGDGYVLSDTSTNGTLVNGQPAPQAYVLADGDRLTIGHYEIAVALDGASRPAAAEPAKGWGGWDSHATGGPTGVDPSSWDRTPAAAAISGAGPMSARMDPAAPMPAQASPGWGPSPAPPAAPGSGWGPAAAAPAAAPASSGWGGAPAVPPATPAAGASPWDTPEAAPAPASPWSSPIGAPPAPAADDIWGRLAASNSVDWSRSGFGVPAPPPPVAATVGLAPPAPAFPPPPAAFAAPPAAPPAAPAPSFAPPPAAAPPPTAPPVAHVAPQGQGIVALLAAAGVAPDALKTSEAEALAAAGQLLRGLVAGLVVMLEARARAKAQMGAQSTALEFDGNNPLKFARAPESALLQLLNPPERGFMASDRAVEDAFFDLQSHQMATLKAMQGALRATLDRFSPAAISRRTEAKGLLAQIMPGARDAALWRAYEKEFGGVAQGSDEAFMDVFAKEFRIAYEEQAAKRPHGR